MTGNEYPRTRCAQPFDQFAAYQCARTHTRAAGFRAGAENPDAAGGTSGLTDLLLKSKNYSRKLSG
jgi:hypothetical protein